MIKKYLFGDRGKDTGLLILRLLTGLYMALAHGFGKITAGPEKWAGLGESMAVFGITFLPVLWGFLAAVAEFFCALLVSIGFYTRAAAFLLFATMGVAGLSHLSRGDGLVGHGSAELAFGYAITFVAVMFMGAGRYSLDHFFFTDDDDS